MRACEYADVCLVCGVCVGGCGLECIDVWRGAGVDERGNHGGEREIEV